MSLLVFPNDGPVVTGMSSDYLLIPKLLSCYQSEIRYGCIHFRASDAEAILFFDPERLMDAVFVDAIGRTSGSSALKTLNESLGTRTYKVSVFTILPDSISFWTSLNHAKIVGQPVRIPFDQFPRLVEGDFPRPKMGFLQVEGERKRQAGWAFIREGEIFGFRHAHDVGSWMEAEELVDFMKLFSQTGALTVTAWGVDTRGNELTDDLRTESASRETISALEELLGMAEHVVGSRTGMVFDIRLRRICIRLAETYDFLDPFAGEFAYVNQKLEFSGEAGSARLMEGVLHLVDVIGQDAGQEADIRAILQEWIRRHEHELKTLQVRVPKLARHR